VSGRISSAFARPVRLIRLRQISVAPFPAVADMTALFWLLSRLPLRVLQAIGAWFGWVAARVPGRYSRLLHENLKRAIPAANEATIADAARSAGRMMFEMPYFWMRQDPLAAIQIEEGVFFETLDAAVSQGRGAMILTPHLGCFEVLAPIVATRHHLVAMYKPPHKPALRAWIERMRTRPNVTMAPAEARGVRMVVKQLKRGGVVGILPDQTPTGGEGAWAPFFGRQAYTMTLVHKLHRLTGAPIVILSAERLARGVGYRLHTTTVPTPLPEDPVAANTIINSSLEEIVRQLPSQYLWGYNRYKHPNGAPPPPA
jgi:KDO2-lipid IV(A) lauroyltransferase